MASPLAHGTVGHPMHPPTSDGEIGRVFGFRHGARVSSDAG